jgi:hypothetical protein
MNITRVFAHAIVRRIAALLVAAALAWVGVGNARAADAACTNPMSTGGTCDDEGQAFKEVNRAATTQYNGNPNFKTCAPYKDTRFPPNVVWRIQIVAASSACPSPPNNGLSTISRLYAQANTCLSRGALGSGWVLEVPSLNQATWPVEICNQGCKYMPDGGDQTYWQIDGHTYLDVGDWSTTEASGNTCLGQNTPVTPPVDTDNDGVSDENDDFPEDPDETTDTDGDGVGDNADVDDEHADNGSDDGSGDESDNHASGGGDCNNPPACDGDGIQCNQLFQQWKTRCAVEKAGAIVTGTPEICESGYTCTGDSAQCAQVALLRKTACTNVVVGNEAAQELLNGLKNGPGDNPNLDPMSVWASDDGDIDPDDSGFGLSRACPPGVTVYGKTISPNCDMVAIIAAIVLLAGMAQFAYAFTQS